MKSTTLLVFIAAFSVLAAGKYFSQDSRGATVEKQDGYYFFLECKPSDAYEVIGTVKHNGFGTNSYTARKSAFLKKLQDFYPSADGVYYDPDITGTYEAFAIKFK